MNHKLHSACSGVGGISGIFFHLLGLDQVRCHNCLKPYFYEETACLNNFSTLLCPSCSKDLLPYSGKKCFYCGEPLPPSPDIQSSPAGARLICKKCRDELPPWNGLAWYGLYEGNLRDIILDFKYRKKLYLVRLLTDFLREACACLPKPDFLLPVPLHWQKLRKRGFNQSAELCRELCKNKNFICHSDILRRNFPSRPQAGLSAQERRKNMEGAFSVKKDLSGSVIWLVDDIMTTGSTFRECAVTLKKAGAAKVYLLCIARTPAAI